MNQPSRLTGPREWLVLSVRVYPDDPHRELLAEGLLALGGLAVAEEDDELVTYLPKPDDPNDFLVAAEHFLGEWIGDDPPALSSRLQPNEDWEEQWKRGLQPRKVSERLVVKPSWTEWKAAPGEIVLDIDPQMAFGTGEHATTRGSLRFLDRLMKPLSRVLDVGSGSAILAIAAARLGAAEVIALEYDPDANLNARENIEKNAVGHLISVHEVLADEQILSGLGSFDLILANILSSVIRPLLPAFARALKVDGRLIVSGILFGERGDVIADARAAGLALEDEDTEEEWWSAAFRAASSH